MKTKIYVCAMLIVWAAVAWAAPPALLTSLSAIHALSNAQAAERLPVVFQATVGYSQWYDKFLFLQDGGNGIFAYAPTAVHYLPGDRVLVRGRTQESFRTLVNTTSITVLRHGAPPSPIPSTFHDLVCARHDSMMVSVHAIVRSVDSSVNKGNFSTQFELLTDGGQIMASIDAKDTPALQGLLDATVEITGVAAGVFDDKMQLTGALLYVSSPANIKVLKRAATTPWELPLTPMDKVLQTYDIQNRSTRDLVQGTITYYQPGSTVVLQNGSKSLWISTLTTAPLVVGDRAEVTGFPQPADRVLTLTDGEIRDTGIWAPITPLPATWHQLGFWSSNSPNGHQNDLVSIEGTVKTAVREASQDEFVLVADGRQFTAIYHHPDGNSDLPPMKQIAIGSEVRVTGICVIADTAEAATGSEVPFNILLRSFDDITVVARPSLLNTRNLIILLSVMLLIVVAVGAWGWTLKTKVHRQTGALASMAQFEQRRSRILEDINGSKPLAEILGEIAAMVSIALDGAPCWCETGSGARHGQYPPDADSLRLVHESILARSGPAQGKLYVAFTRGDPPHLQTGESLSAGARLAALAMETRRLYSDLRHRSEFDLLTDIHNRFSLEKHLDALIEDAGQSSASFGLIYIDLDGFKQVNGIHPGKYILPLAISLC